MLVRRPVGVKGKDWELVEAMGLENDRAQYNQIMVSPGIKICVLR